MRSPAATVGSTATAIAPRSAASTTAIAPRPAASTATTITARRRTTIIPGGRRAVASRSLIARLRIVVPRCLITRSRTVITRRIIARRIIALLHDRRADPHRLASTATAVKIGRSRILEPLPTAVVRRTIRATIHGPATRGRCRTGRPVDGLSKAAPAMIRWSRTGLRRRIRAAVIIHARPSAAIRLPRPRIVVRTEIAVVRASRIESAAAANSDARVPCSGVEISASHSLLHSSLLLLERHSIQARRLRPPREVLEVAPREISRRISIRNAQTRPIRSHRQCTAHQSGLLDLRMI